MKLYRFKNMLFWMTVVVFCFVIGVEFFAIYTHATKKQAVPTASTQVATVPSNNIDQETVVAAIDGIRCDRMEGSSIHIHSHIEIIIDRNKGVVPANIGIQNRGQCYYWLHTHDDTGIIHVESPEKRNFTLGEFFDIWEQPLSDMKVSSYSDGQPIRVYLDGKSYQGDPRQIELTSHENIVLEVGPHFVPPPKPFQFPDGL